MSGILKNFRNIKIFKIDKRDEEVGITPSSPLYSIESVLPDANSAAEISKYNMDSFLEDDYYKSLFIRAKHAILTKLEYSNNKKALIVFARNRVDYAKVVEFVKKPLVELGYSVEIVEKPNKDGNKYIPNEYWVHVSW